MLQNSTCGPHSDSIPAACDVRYTTPKHSIREHLEFKLKTVRMQIAHSQSAGAYGIYKEMLKTEDILIELLNPASEISIEEYKFKLAKVGIVIHE